jgi:HSP20 family molecular chaperone IbpA
MSIIQVDESPAEISIALELPQLDDEELEVTVLDHTITVRGGREDDVEGFGKRPGRSTAFRRELQLPDSAHLEHVTARLHGHSLELHAPKREPRPRRIPVHRPFRLNGAACPD